MGNAYGTHGRDENYIQVLPRKLEGKMPLERRRHGSEDDIKLDLRKQDGNVWTGFIRIRIETNFWLL
jgi:hypothetical protein